MMEGIECLRCHAQLEAGFIGDFIAGGAYTAQKWNPGQPERSFWTGTKIKQEEQLPVQTLRCPKCSYLESYALQGNTSG